VIACISGAYFLIVQRPNIEESGMHSNGYNDLLSIHFLELIVQRPNIEESGMHSNGYNDLLSIHFLELEPFPVFKDMFQTCNTSFYVL